MRNIYNLKRELEQYKDYDEYADDESDSDNDSDNELHRRDIEKYSRQFQSFRDPPKYKRFSFFGNGRKNRKTRRR